MFKLLSLKSKSTKEKRDIKSFSSPFSKSKNLTYLYMQKGRPMRERKMIGTTGIEEKEDLIFRYKKRILSLSFSFR